MKLFHTSPNKIESINRFGNFDDSLFFSTNVYQMSAGKVVVYSIDASEMNFIEAHNLSDDEIVAEIAERFEIDADTAESLLDGSDSVWNYDFADAENDWYIQAKRGECAKKMGFDGCKDQDEQGSVYIIPMLGREAILIEEQ